MRQVAVKRVFGTGSRIVVLIVLLLAAGISAVARTMRGDAERLQAGIAQVDRTAEAPKGEQAVTAGLARLFSVSGDRIRGLRAKQLGLGEIAALLAAATELDGGATDANVNKLAELRLGNVGWVQLARAFNIDLAKASRKVDMVRQNARDLMKKS